MTKIQTPSSLKIPAFVMNFPFTVDNKYPNNVLMNKNDVYDKERAYKQFLNLYHEIAKESLVYILPSERDLQDLPYVANIGAYLPHLEDTILMSNFYSPPRRGEEEIGQNFFYSMNYNTQYCPYYFEGEADLKWIKDNVYASSHGIRTELSSHYWMENRFNMKVVSIKLSDERLYHLDCVLFPLGEKTVVATSVLDPDDIKHLEEYTEIVDIPPNRVYNGWTNCVRIGQKIYHASHEYDKEIERFYYNLGFETVSVELDEFDKSGADLSCLIMHLNYIR